MYVWVIRFVILFAILTVIYVLLSRYSRWDQRRKLEDEYDSDETQETSREQFVADGLARYDRSLRKRLLFGVYLVPLAVVAALLMIATHM